jgi:L-2-hydroxycarboxylate dehydrogenase (NAD+)
MVETYCVVPIPLHNELVTQAYLRRGFTAEETAGAVRYCEAAATHGIHSHNALKALHLDDQFGSRAGGCRPGAEAVPFPGRFKAVERWDGGRKLGPPVAYAAMARCMALADDYGVGIVTVDNAFHYLWGGAYTLEAARQGYLAYACCTAGTAEVVPFQGVHPTMGTNPHSWAFPTQGEVGFPICIDWATSSVAMGRVQQFAREGKPLPPGVAVDAAGRPTTDPAQARWLLFFGQHKGYGLALVNELLAAYTGAGLPTLRGTWGSGPADEKHTPHFFFQCLKPEALACSFPAGRDQRANVAAVLQDIRGHGNDRVALPGQGAARAAALTRQHGGLLFTRAEVEAFARIAEECGLPPWTPARFPQVAIS